MSLVYKAIDVFQHVGVFIGVQAEIVPAHARVFRSRVFAITLSPEDIVLNACHVARYSRRA